MFDHTGPLVSMSSGVECQIINLYPRPLCNDRTVNRITRAGMVYDTTFLWPLAKQGTEDGEIYSVQKAKYFFRGGGKYRQMIGTERRGSF